MYLPPQPPQPLAQVPNNPTTSQRHEMLYRSLANENRTDDYMNIISLLAPPPDITSFGNPGEF